MSGKWLIISDVDGTLTTETSVWETFHRMLGKWETEGLPNLRAFESGTIDYERFAALDAGGYAGLTRETLESMARTIPRRSGMEAMLNRLTRRGFTIVLISTGLDILVNQIPFATVRIANGLKFTDGICTGEADVRIPIGAKGTFARRIQDRFGTDKAHTIVLGDSSGDLPMMQTAGFSIGVAPDDQVRANASAVIDGSDLMRIPPLVMEYRDRVEMGVRRSGR